jgi:hypothetical protein
MSNVEYGYPLTIGSNYSTYFTTRWRYVFTGVNALSGFPVGF